ncbi:MAG: beta-ketoacyl synthase N-terminal-like domain-containing protein, partial [Candidatus Eutrophobiaceae bacterium]
MHSGTMRRMLDFSELDHPPLAIVGMACVFPKAANYRDWWVNLREGVDAITDVPNTHWRPEDYFNSDKSAPDMTYAQRGGFIDPVDFDPLFYGISPNNTQAIDTSQLLGLHVARHALADAGYASSHDADDGRPFDRNRCSVILGVTGTLEMTIPLGARLGHPLWRRALAAAGVAPEVAEIVIENIANSYTSWQENSFPGLLGNVVAGRIANRFDLGGSNCVVDAACASSLAALHVAAMELYAGRSDMAMVGGIDTFNDIFMYMCFSKTPALSPTGDSRPFSAHGDGTILGEGLGAVMLKRLTDAKRDGDRIHAVLRGIGTSSDGRGNAVYAPSAEGQKRCLQNAYHDAVASPASIGLMEAHGTGTTVGDAIESTALIEIYRDHGKRPWCALGSVKSMIGHTKAAAGIASLIKCTLALKHRVLPPTLKVEEPLPQLREEGIPFYLNARKRPWVQPKADESSIAPRRAAISSFGFGGTNFHCILEESPIPTTEAPHEECHTLLFTLCAADTSSLKHELDALESELNDWMALRCRARRSRRDFDPSAAELLCLVLPNPEAGSKILKEARRQLTDHVSTPAPVADTRHIAYRTATHRTDGGLALIFSGQGSQYVGMFRDLACNFTEFVDTMAHAEHLLPGLTEMVWPLSSKIDENQQIALRDTRHTQLALAALGIAASNTLAEFGIRPAAAAGHSFGELLALFQAGRLSTDECLQLSLTRGQLMAAQETGAMLAVLAPAERVKKLLAKSDSSLTLANDNAPEQVAVSGTEEEIQRFEAQCAEHSLKTIRLPVSGAFHSPLMQSAMDGFVAELESISFGLGSLPVYANASAAPYPRDAAAARSLLAEQLIRPVRFVEQVRALYKDGIRCFVEVGPDTRVAKLLRAILKDQTNDALILSLDASRGETHGVEDLACLLARLCAEGHLDTEGLRRWDAACPESAPAKPATSLPLCGANAYAAPPMKPLPPQATVPHFPPQQQPSTDAAAAAQLRLAETGIAALQKLQEQTANLHTQYLKAQEVAQAGIQSLIEGQRLPFPSAVDSRSAQASTQGGAENNLPLAMDTTTQGKLSSQTIHTVDSIPDVGDLLLDIVAEKTGYPRATLSLEMSLDTDLGIDSIKRVEILSTLQKKLPNAAQIPANALNSFHFLRHIVEFLMFGHTTSQDELAPQAGNPLAPHYSKPTATAPADNALAQTVLEVVAEKTGYPLETLVPEMQLD